MMLAIAFTSGAKSYYMISVRVCHELSRADSQNARAEHGALVMGALGGEVRLRQSGINADRRAQATLQGIANSFDPTLLDGIEPGARPLEP
jgi:hypothetical protein